MISMHSLILVGLTVLAGCQTMATGTDVPARITNPSAASREALKNAVNDALHTEVLLAASALTPPRSMAKPWQPAPMFLRVSPIHPLQAGKP